MNVLVYTDENFGVKEVGGGGGGGGGGWGPLPEGVHQ